MKRLNPIPIYFLLLAVFCSPSLPLPAHALIGIPNDECVEDYPSSGEYNIDQNDPDDPGIYGVTSVSNLTYWPAVPGGRAYITSDHFVYCHHYYVEEDFEIHWAYRLWVYEQPNQYEANPRYSTPMDKFDPVEDIMPEPFEESATMQVDVTELSAPKRGKVYHMSAYTRIDAYYGDKKDKKFSWKACRNLVNFTHIPPED